eukprot:SAG22_NODE_432_length_10559_cov_29.404225_11_plen_122_part_00
MFAACTKHAGNPALDELPFGAADYYAINFNDFGSAMVFLFQLLIVNNWQVFMQALVEATNTWAHAYCISFYIIGVVVTFNLVVAHVLAVFLEEVQVGLRLRACCTLCAISCRPPERLQLPW